MSFGRRLELLWRIREAGRELEFRRAGESMDDRVEAALSSARIERLYIEWGLEALRGLRIDGEAATPGNVVERGPEALCREISAEVRRECGLSEEERKN